MTYKFDDIIAQLKKKSYQPIYFLEGEEAYYIDVISDFIEQNVLSAADKSFNQSILYGKDVQVKMLSDTLMRYPMMSQFQTIILKEAADFKALDELTPYFEKPLPSTIFVVCYKHKDVDKRKVLGKLLSKSPHIVHFKSELIREWDIENWIKTYVNEQGYKIRTDTAATLKEYLGTDLSKIANELSKLFLNIPKDKELNNEDVEKYIGISKDYNVFEFQKSLGAKNSLQAYRFVQYSIANDKANPLVMVIASLYGFFSKLFIYQNCVGMSEKDTAAAIGIYAQYPTKILLEYKMAAQKYPPQKMKHVFAILHDFDLKSKGVNSAGGDNGALLQEMTARILNA